MSYTVVSDQLLTQAESQGLSRDARLLHLEAMVHCMTALTDGDVNVRLARFSDADNLDTLADELVTAGWWERTDSGYRVITGMDEQRSRQQIEQTRAVSRAKQSRYRDRQQRHALGDHSACVAGHCKQLVTSHVTGNRTSHVTGSYLTDLPTNQPTDPTDRPTEGREVGSVLQRVDGAHPDGHADDPQNRHDYAPDDSDQSCSICELPQANGVHR